MTPRQYELALQEIRGLAGAERARMDTETNLIQLSLAAARHAAYRRCVRVLEAATTGEVPTA